MNSQFGIEVFEHYLCDVLVANQKHEAQLMIKFKTAHVNSKLT